jgi:uncharacterized protein (DUF433 family)
MLTQTLPRYINRNSEILGTEQIITGTRTDVRVLVGFWRLGIMAKEILNHLPHLIRIKVML